MKILIVEDDDILRNRLIDRLVKESFQVQGAGSLQKASDVYAQFIPDIIILDWNLPDGEGIVWLIHQRKSGMAIPVLMLSARDKVIDKITGLNMGSSDYLTKPFEMDELLARIQSLLGTNIKQYKGAHRLQINEVYLDTHQHIAYWQEVEIPLTPMEYKFLEFLFRRPNQVYTREELLEQVWRADPQQETRAVDNVVFQLRKKLPKELIMTVKNAGYRINGK